MSEGYGIVSLGQSLGQDRNKLAFIVNQENFSRSCHFQSLFQYPGNPCSSVSPLAPTIRRLHSAFNSFRLPNSVLCLLTSVLCPLTSVFYPYIASNTMITLHSRMKSRCSEALRSLAASALLMINSQRPGHRDFRALTINGLSETRG
jgi:hypothetical protein